jgi:hypothetical protein
LPGTISQPIEGEQVQARIDLYADEHAGSYVLSVRAAPEGIASPEDIPGKSADLVLDGRPARTDAVASLSFSRLSSNTLGDAPLAQPGCIVTAYLYHAKNEAEMLAFDERITAEYTAFYLARGMSYLGAYRATGPIEPCIGEFMVYHTMDPEEVERIGNDDLPPAIVAIEDECRALQDRDRRRYVVTLTPN